MNNDDAAALREVEAGIAENIRRGFIVRVGTDDDGEPTYAMTDAGRNYVENVLGVMPREHPC